MDTKSGDNWAHHPTKQSQVADTSSGSNEETQPTPKSVVSDFCDYTSTHGPGHVKRVQAYLGKAIWLLITLGLAGVMVWQLVVLVIAFKRFDYNVLVEVKFSRTVEFPSVTVCNMNPFRKTKVVELAATNTAFHELYDQFVDANNNTATSRRRRRRRSVGKSRRKRSSPTTLSPEETEYDYDYWENNDIDYYDYEEEYQSEMTLREAINALPGTVKQKLGHKLSNMLLECTYSGRTCTIKNFTTHWNYLHGSCYTFTGSGIATSEPGPENGLELKMYIELNEYLVGMSEDAGLKVVVHDTNTVPFPDRDGFIMSAGFSTLVGLRKLQVDRLSSPYYDCTEASTVGTKNIYSHQYNDSYSLHVCEVSCYQHTLIKECDCVDSEYPTDNPDLAANNTEAYCYSNNGTECQKQVWEEYISGTLTCGDCTQVCNEIKYYTTISSAVWPIPTPEVMEDFQEELASQNRPSLNKWLASQNGLSSYELASEVRNNVAKLTIYFEDLNYERIYQTPAYTWISFISNLGGLFGLWIGMSVLSICEWFEFFGRLALSFCNKRQSQVGSQG